jgi:hypothetical protein
MTVTSRFSDEYVIDPALKTWASERQAQYIDAVNEHGTFDKAAAALGVGQPAISGGISRARANAAEASRQGRAPGHFNHGVAPGYVMGKVTVQRAKDGEVERTWERQSPDQRAMAEAMRAAAEAMAEELPRAAPIDGPAHSVAALCNVYTLTDCHVGMLAWAKETGHDWDLSIAEDTLTRCFTHAVNAAPAARVGFVNQLGDFMHYDGLLPVTPQHGHVLDADGRFSKMVATAIRVLRTVVAVALARHEKVVLLLAEGNHDMASSSWLRHMFAALYENEPRVHVIDSELPYYAYRHGATMLAFHHGHLKKNDQLPLTFAAQFPKEWGATKHRYAHTGHRHHVDEREHSGMIVVQHPTLAGRDAYAARGGWIAARAAKAITYHYLHGEVARVTVTPEMLADDLTAANPPTWPGVAA